jgi:hypothetical protein
LSTLDGPSLLRFYGVAVRPVTTESSDVSQQEHKQQFWVLVDKDKEAVIALRCLNTQVKDPQLALLIAPEGGLSKMYSEAVSSTQANKILKDAQVLSKGVGNMDKQYNGEQSQGVDQTASSETTSPTKGGPSTIATAAQAGQTPPTTPANPEQEYD